MITNKLKLDLKHCGITPTIDAAQEDILSRGLELSLYDGKKAYLLPENLAVLIHYKKADGKGGEYDTLPDGRPAWSAHKNRLTILLAHQIFTFPGFVDVTVSLVSGGKQISTFPIQINVLPEARPLSENSEDYFNITGFLVAPGNAESGQFLKIRSVNSEGRVTEVEPGLPDQTPADWNASEGEPGHILNRPFYEADGELKTIDKKFLPDDVGGVNVSGAAPGQMIIVKSVDEAGKPTQWEAVDPIAKADWSAGEEEPGHIMNRPFYSDYKTETLLETTTLTADASFANFEGVAVLPGPFALQEGMICNVVYNGAAYTCTVKAADFQGLSCFAFGNQIVVTGENTGEPFTVCAFSEDSTAITGIYGGVFPVDGSTTFSMSIASITEIVTPVPEKYLTKARGQKKYTIDLDSSTTDVSVDTLMKMDAAEIQSVLTVIYEGLPHSASVEEMASETVSGTTFSSILFSVHLAYGETVTFQYHNFGEGSLEILRTGYNVQYNYHPDRCNLFVKRKGDPYPTWEAIDDKESAFPGIMLKSPGNKVFWITVDDAGNLTATQK